MENDVILDLTLPENRQSSKFISFLKLLFFPLIFFLVFVCGYFGVLNFKVELHSIVMMGILFIISSIFIRHNASYVFAMFEDNIDDFKNGLKNFIISHLFIIGNKKKSNVDFYEFSDEFNQNLRNENYSSIAFGIFPMLGILGTFISIAISMPNFSSKDISSLENEIAQLLSGVGTAFYVSIYGIFLAIWWIYFEKRGLSKLERLILNYKKSTKSFFWSKDEINQQLMQELILRNDRFISIFRDISGVEFTNKTSDILRNGIIAFENILNAQENISVGIIERIKLMNESLEKYSLIEQNYCNKLHEAGKNIANFSESFNNFKLEFQKYTSSLNKNTQELTESMNDIFKDLKNTMVKFEHNLSNFVSLQDKKNMEFIDKIGVAINGLQADLGEESILEELKSVLKDIDNEK